LRTQSAFQIALQDEGFRKKYGLASEEMSFETKSLLYFVVAGDPAVAEYLLRKGFFVVKDATTNFLST
jgi:hypothetical protein